MNLSEAKKKLKCLAVTKGRTIFEIQEMLDRTRFTRIGENRLEEAKEKFHAFPTIEKHFIGKLQSRKIPEIVSCFDVIQSLETLKQAELINEQGKDIGVFLQVNLDGSRERSGCKPEEVPPLIKKIQSLPHLRLLGLMGMASPSSEKAKEQFKTLKKLQGQLLECSMGMSSDYLIAIEEGATMLRLGSILFDGMGVPLPDGVELE